jgi:hypothetical protein
MAAVRRYVTDRAARRLLRGSRSAIERLLAIPPGNMLLDRTDPQFRVASKRCAGIYRSTTEIARNRIAAIAGVLYQVRCNLVHGSKDPDSERDRMLVRESITILRVLTEI